MLTPAFVFDSRERWFPVGVEESLSIYGFEWDFQARSWEAGAADLARLDFPAGMKQPDLSPVVYHRVKDGGHLWWHQFWLWYLYNPKTYATMGAHEGDWEMVQIGCTDKAGTRPVLITASQHQGGGRCMLGDWELRDGHPTIYVALGSHANYFTAFGALASRGRDECDGKGRVVSEYELREFGPWKDWPGRWGNSTGEGKSPASPGRQGHRWSRPDLYHLGA